jgi:intracellular sulfur oxidation DsrE/DsrF family protein
MKSNTSFKSRRQFIGTLAAGTGLLATSIPTIASPVTTAANQAEDWFKQVKGKHRIIYDAPEVHGGFPIIWSWVFLKTNNETGSPDTDLTALVVLRHNGIVMGMDDKLWAKYKLGEQFKVTDMTTNAPSLRNPFNVPTDGAFKMLGIDGIKALQARGVMFCVCDMALTVNSMMAAKGMNMTPEDVKKEWVAGLLPGVQVVPSGVWAVARAQEKGCSYCYAGG